MDFDFLKNVIDFIKAIQAVEYVVKKVKYFHNWSKNNIDKILKFIYSKITNTIIYLFLRFAFFIFTLYGLLTYSLVILKDNLSFNNFLLATGTLMCTTVFIWFYLDRLYKSYHKDRTSYLRTKHSLDIV